MENPAEIHSIAVLFLVVICAFIVAGGRTTVVGALLATAAFLPLGQQFIVCGLHFTFLRVAIIASVLRVIIRGEARGFTPTSIDKLVAAWVLVGLTCGILRGARAEMFGAAYNSLGTYFIFRVLTRDLEEVVLHVRALAGFAVIVAGFMGWEALRHMNPFAVLGGVPEVPDIRDGRRRCQGPFRHPILAGCFGATLFPLMWGLWFSDRRNRFRAGLGAAGSFIITGTSVSSGALMAILSGIAGVCLWPLRGRMRTFRRGVVLTVIGLAVVMQAPVWYLISKISDLIGGGGWHRSYLIDQFVKHFGQWWLIGTSYTANWAPDGLVLTVDPNNMDITNHYVAQGVGGGIWMLGLFILILVRAFQTVGNRVRQEDTSMSQRKFIWSLGIALAGHCTAFISISYFDQIAIFFFWLLAVMSFCSSAEWQSAKLAPIEQRSGGFYLQKASVRRC